MTCLKCGRSEYAISIPPDDDLHSAIALIRARVDAHLSGRSGAWAASFAELVVLAGDSGVPIGGLQAVVARYLGPGADGDAVGLEERENMIEALVGRWAAASCYGDRDS